MRSLSVASAGALCLVFFFLLVVSPTNADALQATTAPQQRITEDDPRWDCRTMGNKVCGPNQPKPVFTCGAPTKKSTACKRRVKTQGEKCYQHKGR